MCTFGTTCQKKVNRIIKISIILIKVQPLAIPPSSVWFDDLHNLRHMRWIPRSFMHLIFTLNCTTYHTLYNCRDITQASWRTKTIATRLFVQHLVETYKKDTSKLYITRRLGGTSVSNRCSRLLLQLKSHLENCIAYAIKIAVVSCICGWGNEILIFELDSFELILITIKMFAEMC